MSVRPSPSDDPQEIRDSLREHGAYFNPRTGKHVWTFWDAQERAIEALESGDHDIVVFRGGYGSGKSVLGARETLKVAWTTPGADCLVLAQDAAKGGPTTYKVFFKQLPGTDTVPDEGGDPENSPWVADYNRNKSRVTLTNGSVIRLGSADKWNRYAGAEFNFVWADEVAHYTNTDLYKLNRMLISRQRTSEGPNVSLWTSTGNGYNQFYDFVERQVDADEDPLTVRIKNILADSRNNPFLAEKDKLTRQFENTAAEEQGLAGGFAAAEGLVYSRFSRERHVISDTAAADRVREDDWRIYGYDAGWSDPSVVLEIGQTDHGQLVVLNEFYESEAQVGDPNRTEGPRDGTILSWLDGRPSGTIYAEHEPSHIDKFQAAGWRTTKAKKSLDEGIPSVRERLMRDHEGEPGLLVSQSCINLVQEFLSYQEDQVGKSSAEDHAVDSLRYAIHTDANPDTTVRRRDPQSAGKY